MQTAEYHNMARAEQSHWWYTGMAAIAEDWLQRAIPAGANHRRVLDGGCGTGATLGWLARFGQTCGVDAHPLALELAQTNGCRRLVQSDVCALPFAAGSFAALTSLDVLCQLERTKDWLALREFARVLQPGGWLLVRVPAHDWLRGAHDLEVQTRHRYSRRELSAKLKAVGLQPIRVSYANALLFAPAVGWRVAQRLSGRPAASDVRGVPGWLNDSLRALLGAERAWLRRFNLPVGLSLLALAQKESA